MTGRNSKESHEDWHGPRDSQILKTGGHSGAPIAPFYENGGRHSRLKMATYEGRIGNLAYRYNKQGRLDSLKLGEELLVKANSIVFVE